VSNRDFDNTLISQQQRRSVSGERKNSNEKRLLEAQKDQSASQWTWEAKLKVYRGDPQKALEERLKGGKRDRVKAAIGQKLVDFGLKLCKEKKCHRLTSSVGSSESPKGIRWPRTSVSISGRAPDYERRVSPLTSDPESLGNPVRTHRESLSQNVFNPPQPSDREGITSLPSNRFTPTPPYPPDLQGTVAEPSSESDRVSIKVGPDIATRL
jgi:hypothetical protein